MKIIYSIPTQTVTLDVDPSDLAALGNIPRDRIKDLFTETIESLKAHAPRKPSRAPKDRIST